LLTLGLSACTPVFGGIALLGVISVGALTSRCYDYVDVTVLDADGRKTCAARVTASKGKSQFDFPSCYSAPLTDGQWTLRASLAGAADAVSNITVDHTHDCTRYVQSLELTLHRVDSASPRPAATSPAVPVPVAPPAPSSPAATPTTTATAGATPPPVAAPSAPGAPPSTSPSVAPMPSATPPVGVFPDNDPNSAH